ncbi:MAG: hypothetical protein IJ290_04090 [Bacteroidaceae bacterium]|nr:hypothetical protein [Bacteroidaceae bacterium]
MALFAASRALLAVEFAEEAALLAELAALLADTTRELRLLSAATLDADSWFRALDKAEVSVWISVFIEFSSLSERPLSVKSFEMIDSNNPPIRAAVLDSGSSLSRIC